MPKKRLSELSLRGHRVLFLSKLELSSRQRGKYLHISRDQSQRSRSGRGRLLVAVIRSQTRIYRLGETRSWIRAAVVVNPVDRCCEI
jgi:hypothetical protein